MTLFEDSSGQVQNNVTLSGVQQKKIKNSVFFKKYKKRWSVDNYSFTFGDKKFIHTIFH